MASVRRHLHPDPVPGMRVFQGFAELGSAHLVASSLSVDPLHAQKALSLRRPIFSPKVA
jgi:hypothetical protein